MLNELHISEAMPKRSSMQTRNLLSKSTMFQMMKVKRFSVSFMYASTFSEDYGK